MTDLALTTMDGGEAATPRKGRRRLLLALPLLLAAIGAGSTFMGLWSPFALLQMRGTAADAAPAVIFVDVPPINVTLPDTRPRLLHLAVKLETTEEARPTVEHLLPRVSDAFNTFLTGIAPQAFDRRGILEVVREELTTRARLAVGPDTPLDVLVTEFALK